MTLQDPTRLRRRSRLRRDVVPWFAAAAFLAALGTGPATAASPGQVFPNMAYTVGDDPVTVASADLDHDGIRDLVVANRWSEDLSILRGLGGGDFAAQVRLAAGGIPVALAIADFNGDGRDDVAAALPIDDKVAVFLTQANGLPGAPQYLPAGDSPGGLLAADLDRDGKVDLVATNYFSDTISLWRGLGNGGFGPEVTRAAGTRPYGVVAALLDGNLDPDLVVASYGSSEVVVFLADGAGGFGAPTAYSTYASGSYGGPRSLLTADVDADGAVDLLVGNFDNDEEFNSVALLRGRGDGSLAEASFVARSNDGSFALGAGDFNRDGRPDVAFGAHHGFVCCDLRDGRIALGRGDGGFDVASRFRTGVGLVALTIDDFDRDGLADIAAISDVYWDEVSINLGRGDGTMGREPELIDGTMSPGAVALADVDGDGWSDVVTTSFFPGGVRVLLSVGPGQVSPRASLPLGVGPATLAVDDFNGDAMADIAVRGDVTGILSYFRAVGGGAFAAPLMLLAGESARGLTAGDVTGDGVSDLVALSAEGGGRVIVFSRPGEAGGFTLTLDAALEFPDSVVTGDFDGDGHRDIAAIGAGTVLLRGLGAGLFAPPVTFPEGGQQGAVRSGDINGDGRDDIVYAGGARVLLGQADGTLQSATPYLHHTSPTDLALSDFDADGTLDIVTLDGIDEQSDLSLILQAGSLPGPVARRVLVRANYRGLAAGDLDRDGRPDLIVRGVFGLYLIRNQGPVPNHAPRAVPAAEPVLECTGPDGAQVTLDGRSSSDPDSTTPAQEDLATFEWFEDFGTASERLLATGALVGVTLPLGEHSLTLKVADRAGATGTADFLVTVVDTTAPAAAAAMAPGRLWPPNHEYATVRANLTATDLCGPASITLVSVRSSEPDDIIGGGDGTTRDDIAGAALGTADLEVLLRAERDGLGGGRTYTLTWRIEDVSGNATVASAEVLVPISQSGRGGTIGTPPGHGASGGSNNGGGHSGSGQQRGPKPRPANRP